MNVKGHNQHKKFTINERMRSYFKVDKEYHELHPIEQMLFLDHIVLWAERQQRRITEENANDLIYSNYQATL